MCKHFFELFVLFAFIALTSLVGCGVSILETSTHKNRHGGLDNCTDPADIPALKEALISDKEVMPYVDTGNWVRCIDRIDGPSAVAALAEVMLQSKRGFHRQAALRLLNKRSGPNIVSMLRQALSHKGLLSISAAKALAGRNAVHALIPALADERYDVRHVAQEFLGDKLSYMPVVQAMCHALSSDNVDVRYETTKILTTKEPNHPCVIPALSKVVKDKYLETRQMAVKFFADEERKNPSVVPPLCEAVMDENQEIRELAVNALTRYYHYYDEKGTRSSPIFPALMSYLKTYSADSLPGRKAVRYLAYFDHHAAVPVLKDIIHKTRGGNYDAFVALAMIDMPQMLAFAEQIVKEDVDLKKRKQAAHFLGLGEFPQAELLSRYLAEDGDVSMRSGAILGLMTMAERLTPQTRFVTPSPFSPSSFPGLSDKDRLKVQEVAVRALIKVVNQEKITELRGVAINAIGKFRDKSAVPVLERIGLDEEDANRSNAVCALGHLVKTVSPVLRKAAKDPDRVLRECVAGIMRYVLTREAASLLVNLMTQDPNRGLRQWAQKSLNFGSDPTYFIPMLAKALPGSDTKVRLAIVATLYRVGRVRDEKHHAPVLSVLKERLKVETTPSVRKKIKEAVKFLRDKE